ncbi:uncharacterized protein LOC113557605 [Rhopalosiphum maidis]|uniref:uncharacterized protein LOC113557605 n=1 Tax=Rhopalosiphum maidis TaxID=43146 RepID=UPI000EFDC048|nr:uncharacterized protein LOC113557605 [Rhopalosiphum maidis]
MMRTIKRTGMVTINRNCLSQIQHTALLSTPKGHVWTHSRSLNFIMEKCRKTSGITLNDRRRETGKHTFFEVNTTMWPLFVKQFLKHGEYSLAPAIRIILSKILPTRVNFSDPKWSKYKNTQTELCRFLRNLNPECDSIDWKGDFFKTLSSLIFDYMVQVLCSGQISKKRKMTQMILKKINDITDEYVLLNSPGNFLQGVQIFVANMLSLWLEKPINNICSKGNNNKGLKNRNIMNDIAKQRNGIKTKHSKNNEVGQNKTNILKLKTAIEVKTNQKSKKGKFTKPIVKDNLSSQNSKKATNKIKTNRKSKKGLKSESIIGAVNDLQKIIEQNEILSNVVLVNRSVSKTTIKKKIKNKLNNFGKKNQKPQKNKISKTIVKGKLSQQNLNKATKKINTNKKSKKGLKSKSIISAINGSKKFIKKNEMLSNSVLVKPADDKNVSETNIINEKNSNIPDDECHNNTNGRDKNINGKNSNYRPVIDNEKLSDLTKQLHNENTFEANNNGNDKNDFINNDALDFGSLRPATDAENIHSMTAMNHGGRNDDGHRITSMDDRSKSHYDGGSKLLLEHGSTPAMSNGISNSYNNNNVNEEGRILNVTDISGHTLRVTEYLLEEKYDTILLKDEELLKYNDNNSHDIDDAGYSDLNTDCDNGFDDDNGHHIIIMNEDGKEFESRVLDDLVNIFLNSSPDGWSNEHDNATKVIESRRDESKQNYFQRCADGYTQKLANNFRNKKSKNLEVCDQSKGVTYNICKKDGSNYSVRKTILPLRRNQDHRCIMCSLDKSKLLVNTLIKEQIFCDIPFNGESSKLIENDQSIKSRSVLAKRSGFSPKTIPWKKLYGRLPLHENSETHRTCYCKWKNVQLSLFGFGVDSQLQKTILSEAEKWKAILKRLLDVTLFLASRGLPFQGSSTKIGEVNNGNFLGILEFFGRYDEVTRDHLATVEKYQNKGESMKGKTHYLSWMSQNEFISLCGESIASELLKALERHKIPLADCRAQAYDKGANMSGKIKSVQARILEKNHLALYSPCSAHSLNLVGVNAVKINSRVKTFFGCVQTLYVTFSSSPAKWSILNEEVNISLESQSETRWSSRVSAIRLIVHHLPDKEKRTKKRKVFHDEVSSKTDIQPSTESIAHDSFRRDVIFASIDFIITDLTHRFEAHKKMCDLFSPILCYMKLSSTELEIKLKEIIKIYSDDLSPNILNELLHLRKIHKSVFLTEIEIPPLKIFCTLPVTVSEAERAFSKLGNQLKTWQRASIGQERLNALGILSIEHKLASSYFKDEMGGKFLKEFVTLRPKLYANRTVDDIEVKKAKVQPTSPHSRVPHVDDKHVEI